METFRLCFGAWVWFQRDGGNLVAVVVFGAGAVFDLAALG